MQVPLVKKRSATALIALLLPFNSWAVEEIVIESLQHKVERLEIELEAIKTAIKMQSLAPAPQPAAVTTNFIMDTSSALTWSGFATTAVARSDSETPYLDRFADREDYTDTRLGLNVSAHLTESITIAGQILMAGREHDYTAHADWIFATWRPVDWADVMIGRIKYPNLLFSEVYDVGAVMPWIRPPQELYTFHPLSPNYTYEVMNAVSTRFTQFIGDYELTIQPYAGHAEMEFANIADMTGITASIGDDEAMLLLGYNSGDLDFGGGGHGTEHESGADVTLFDVMGSHLDGMRRDVISVGISIDKNNFLMLAEWAESDIKDRHHEGFDDYNATSWYTMLGYRIGDWTPHLTYAKLDQDSGTGQDSITVGLRYDVSPSVALKIELSHIDPESRKNPVTTDDLAPEGGHDAMAMAEDDHGGMEMAAEESEHGDEAAEPIELAHPAGLFPHMPSEGEVNLFTIGIDFTF